jgi:hypothetical protein
MHTHRHGRAFARCIRSSWLIPICWLLLTQAASAQPVGWSTARSITVTENSGATLNGYQLKLAVDTQTLVSYGLMNPDGSDLRFGADEQGNTQFNYWIESGINTPATVVWVRLGTLPASSSIGIWMYTGNPLATNASSLLGTFDYTSQLANSATAQVSGANTGGFGNTQRGFRFSTSQDILAFQFGKNEPTGSTRYVTLFDFSTQAILRQIQVSGLAGQYDYADLPQPIWLTPENQYLLEMYQNTSDGYYFGAAPQMNPLLTYYDMRYCNGCTQNTFPTSSLGGMHYGYSDFEFATRQQVSPEPTAAIGPGVTNTDLMTDIPSANFAAAVTFTATVNGLFNPSGTVAFYDTNGVDLLSDCANPAPLNLVGGQLVAACTTTSLTPGAHSIQAHYSGDGENNLPSDASPLAQQISTASSSTDIDSACMRTFTSGQQFTMTAAVTAPLAPTGNVTFLSGGITVLCADVPLVSGSASCTTSALIALATTEPYDLTASYAGDSNDAASASPLLSVLVLDAADVVFRNGLEIVPPSCPLQ